MAAENYLSELPIRLEIWTKGVQDAVKAAIQKASQDEVVLTTTHILFGIAVAEWGWFHFTLSRLGLSPEEVRELLKSHLSLNKDSPVHSSLFSLKRYVSDEAKVLFQVAEEYGIKIYRRWQVDLIDVLMAIFEQPNNIGAQILSKYEIGEEEFRSRFYKNFIVTPFSEDNIKEKYQLPPNLAAFATNLNWLSRQDKISPLYGRTGEMSQMIEILCHRERPNSVMLIGDPGVGKTAIVDGLARKIEFEPANVPSRLRDCQVVNLSMNSLVAGTQLRGMFEDRIQNVILEIKAHPNLILFIDEAHTIIGAGSAIGAPSDAAQVFKSVMARGEVRVIAATTLGEYKEFIKGDEALDRRFRIVNVREPDIEETRFILNNVKPRLEVNYSTKIEDEAIETALDLTPRYNRHLRLPDKVIGWLDTAAVRGEIAGKKSVGADDVIDVVSKISGIPIDMISRDVSSRFETIERGLAERVIGQNQAIEIVAKRLRLNKGPLKDNFFRPDGIFLFLGPTGVGKTELAKALAEFMFGDENKMVRIDMSECQDDATSVEKLIGYPRGIVGSEKGGVLTNQLKDNPYTVLLLDELEKSSSRVLNLFLQAFGEGWITDGNGRKVYLSDAVVIMTSNLGSQHFRKLTNPMGFRSSVLGLEQIRNDIKAELERRFSPEFLNRIDEVIIFNPLSREEIGKIAEKLLGEMKARMAQSKKSFVFDDSVIEALVKSGYSLAYGVRFLKRVVEDHIKIPINAKWKEGNLFRVFCREDKINVEVDK